MNNATLQSFQVFLTERLTAAAFEIFGFVEKIIIDYEEEVHRKEENRRQQRLPRLVYQPEILRRAVSKHPAASESAEVIFTKQQEHHPQEWSPSVDHEDTGTSRIKEEEDKEARLTSSIEEQPSAKDNDEDFKHPKASESAEGISTKQQEHNQQEWSPSVDYEEMETSNIKEEEYKEALLTSSSGEQPSAKNTDEGDALTEVFFRTGQQLENNVPTKGNSKPKQSFIKGSYCSDTEKRTINHCCHICNKVFNKKLVLDWHLKTHGIYREKFDCKICGQHNHCQSQLQNHMRVHTGERPYPCQYCKKCFKLKGDLTNHIRIHTGEMPFSCYVCQRSFKRSSSMKRHVSLIHKGVITNV
ncbi:zinc finger protein 37-like [Lampris incognitus]|uniref:zinc finger protein 37-like n=1 Tax=Lampris incognitus TaxID=2546036 RepID=UPI0024B578FD|nr:zinc finger protein 37-like [Lampris incognitus]